jgi:hypothetical protein
MLVLKIGVGAASAYAMFAVTTAATSTSTQITQQFRSAGFAVSEHPQISQTRTDHAVVISAVRPDATASRNDQIMAVINTTAGQMVTAPHLQFQPVWEMETWSRTGLELLVDDDDDASVQLDALSEALSTPRRQITIKPTSGWQRYGWPELQNQ